MPEQQAGPPGAPAAGAQSGWTLPLDDVAAERRSAAVFVVGVLALVLAALDGLHRFAPRAGPVPDGDALAGVVTVCMLAASAEFWRTRRRARRALGLLAHLHAAQCEQRAEAADARARIRQLIDQDLLGVALQPIVEVRSGRAVGFEALARFPLGSTESWFSTAADVGLLSDLELYALRRAIRAAQGHLPARTYLSLNVSPATLLTPELEVLLQELPAGLAVVVELTEHAAVDSYEAHLSAIGRLRRLGLRLAVDDAGAGYASLRHIAETKPDLIKVDRGLISDIHRDPTRRIIVTALATLARDLGATIVAEGVEHEPEADTLRTLGITHCQGYYFGRPEVVVAPGELVAPSPARGAVTPDPASDGVSPAALR